MANEQFTQLPATGAAQLTDIICAVQGYVSPSILGTSVQETLAQVLALFQSNTVFVFSGNPNGNVAGVTYNLCWDATDKLLYVCTTSGSTSTAVWTPCVGQLLANQILVGVNSTTAPIPLTVTAGTGMSIVAGGGNLTFSATGGASFPWVDVTSTSASMGTNTGYLANNVSLVTLTLPATAAFGSIIYIAGNGSGGWSIAQNSGQNIQIGTMSSTVGTGGSVSSMNRYDSLTLVCTVANTTFMALGGPQGNLTLV